MVGHSEAIRTYLVLHAGLRGEPNQFEAERQHEYQCDDEDEATPEFVAEMSEHDADNGS